MSTTGGDAPCSCRSEARLGPFLFTFRAQPSGHVVTVPALLVPLQWPPTSSTIPSPPDAAFVYTTFDPSPVQPVCPAPQALVAQLGWDAGSCPTPNSSSTQPQLKTETTRVTDAGPCSSVGGGNAASLSKAQSQLPSSLPSASGDAAPGSGKTQPTLSANSATPHARPRLASYDESDFVPLPGSPTEFLAAETVLEGAKDEQAANPTMAPKFKRKGLPGEWTRDACPSVPFPVVNVDDEPPSPPFERPSSAASAGSPGHSLRRRPTSALRATASPTPSIEPSPATVPATPPMSLNTRSLSSLRPGLSEHREVARLLAVETRPAPTPPRSSSALQEVTGAVVNASSPPQRPPRHPLRGVLDPKWFATYPGPKHSQKCFNLSALAKTPDATPPVTPAELAKMQQQQAAAPRPGKTLAEVAKEAWNQDRSHSTTFYTATGSDPAMSAYPSNASNLVADPVTHSTDPRSPTSSSVSAHHTTVEFSGMQEAVAVLAEMLQHSLHITEYLEGQMNDPAVEVSTEVDELDSSTQEADDEDSGDSWSAPLQNKGKRRREYDEDDIFDEYLRVPSSSDSPTPRATPAPTTPPSDPRTPSPHVLDMDREISTVSRTLSYTAPTGYTHVDDTTLTSIPEEDTESLTSFDSSTSASGASPTRSSPGGSGSPQRAHHPFTTPKYVHGGSLPTIAEALEEWSDASPSLNRKLSALSMYSQNSSQSEF